MRINRHPNESQHEALRETSKRDLLNKRITKLSFSNVGLIIAWYFMATDRQHSLDVNGTAEYDLVYKIFLLALTALTIWIWASIGKAFWQRLRINNVLDSTSVKASNL